MRKTVTKGERAWEATMLIVIAVAGAALMITLLPRWVTVSGVPATQGNARPMSE
jgi:hypothetical protein